METTCHICSAPTLPFAKGKILDRHQAEFFRCPDCGFVQAGDPVWLEESYSQAITRSDIGLAGRNLSLARTTDLYLRLLFGPAARREKYLDYGAGYGLLVRLMRDRGYDFYWQDDYCRNIFAQGFEAETAPEKTGFKLLTAFEVFEHLPLPGLELKKMLGLAPNILFTTLLLPEPAPPLDQWWYYGLEHGQHISFYTKGSLARLAEQNQLHLFSIDAATHLFTAQPASMLKLRLAARLSRLIFPGLERQARKNSLLARDFEKLTGKRVT